MEIQLGHLRPHATLCLFRSAEAIALVTEVAGKLEEIVTFLPRPPSEENTRRVQPISGSEQSEVTVRAAWYRLERAPGWIGVEDELEPPQNDSSPEGNPAEDSDQETAPLLLDQEHHLVVLMAYDGYVGVYASQEALRTRLAELIEFGSIGEEEETLRIRLTAAALSRQEIEAAFVRGKAKSAWLEGLHASNVMKADRKILTGPNLRYAISRQGDQTYVYTAAISEIPDDNGKKDSSYRIGVSHSKGTLWTRSTKTFGMFVNEFKEMVSRVKAPPPALLNLPEHNQAGLPFVARPLASYSLTDLQDGFDVGYEVPTQAEEEIIRGAGVNPDPDDGGDTWQQHGRFTVQEGAGSGPGEIVADAYYDSTRLARVSLRPIIRGGDQLDILHRVLNYWVAKDDSGLVAMDQSLARRNARFTLRYGSGHVIQGGIIFMLNFRDAVFDRWRWIDFGTNYEVDKEKPEKPAAKKAKVFDPTKLGFDRSLFCYIKNNVGDWIAPQMGMAPSDQLLLLCDDGPGEIADFIAIDPHPDRRFVTLVHVKAAEGSINRISVGPFSEVTSQALKNLREVDLKNLADDLAKRKSTRNAKWTWRRDGTVIDRDDFIASLRTMGRGAQRHVVLFQPRIAKPAWDAAVTAHRNDENTADVGRMRQLSALLSSAEEMFRQLETGLTVIGRD